MYRQVYVKGTATSIGGEGWRTRGAGSNLAVGTAPTGYEVLPPRTPSSIPP